MDLNNYIITNSKDHQLSFPERKFRGAPTNTIDHVSFKVIHSIDKDCVTIPEWFKKLRFIALIDYCINNGLVHKDNIFYYFSHRLDPRNLKLDRIVFSQLGLVDLTNLSKILPAEDILEHVKFKPSEPYQTVDRPDKVCYFLHCEISWANEILK